MRISALRRGLGFGASIMLAAGLAFTAAPAQASERPIDITGYKVSDVTVGDSNCRNVTVSAFAKTAGDYVDSYGSIDVTKQGGIVTSMWFEDDELDRAFICPSLYGLGTYKVGPADINAEYEYYDDYFEEYDTHYTSYTDYTSKTFYVRGKTKSSLSAKRSGSKVTLTAKAQVYTPNKYRYAQYNATGAKFQVKSGSTWKTLKTVKLKSGKASVTVKQSKKKTYRLYIPKASWATSTTSKSVSK
ncbi:hypothetical protein ACFY5D_18650 [Paeniglutamicibacter sp. NPDC012692]|uniref:hypothetical protein n=1 Tax=Paeniglutamicibacter sp. NPDC012692 TaxID=3364388 RepID=UPI0036B09E59